MARKIDAAADNGVDTFLFDWYHYDDGPFLNNCLDRGYLQAPNRSRVKFALMWANHDWTDIHPYSQGTPYRLLYPGVVSSENFEKIGDHLIQHYFIQPSYWQIEGKPYFSFYDLSKLIANFGSVEAARDGLDQLRAKAIKTGLSGLHLNAVGWGQPILPGEKTPTDIADLINALGFDSVTSYVWIHHVSLDEQQTNYDHVRDKYNAYWDKAATLYGLPFFPNVSMGWDSSPRANQNDPFGNTGYPFTNTISGNTPERFREALEIAKQRLLALPNGPRILTINSWNEWTEGSYIEPDTVHRMQYLEAIRSVFRPEQN